MSGHFNFQGMMGYGEFVASQKKKGITAVGGDGSYNRYTASFGGGQANAGQSLGMEAGVAYPNEGTPGWGSKVGNFMQNKTIAGRVGKITDGYLGGFGTAIANLSGKLLGGGSNRDFDGTRLTGGAQAWVDKGGRLSSFSGDAPTQAEFTGKGRWLMPKDEYANDYGRAFTDNDAQYYANFKGALDKFKAAGDTKSYNATLQAHGFKSRSAPAPAPSESGGGGRRSPSNNSPAPFKQSTPKQNERDQVTPPAKGLENTIKTAPKLLRERRRRSYLTG